jgi:PAS domain S-box-containing protein
MGVGLARGIIEALAAHICLLDEHGTILFVNEAWRRFGRENPPIPDDYFVGDNYLAVCDRAEGHISAEAAPFAAGLRALFRGEIDRFALEYPCHAPGIERWFLARATRLAGAPPRVVVAHEDLSERRRAEQALHDSEARMRALFEHSLVAILLTAPDGRILQANPAACRLFGRSEEEICSLGRAGVVDPSDVRFARLLKERAQRGHGVGEVTHVRADGTRFPALVSSAVFGTTHGARTVTVIQDVTDVRLKEQRIQDFSRRLLSVQEEEKRRLSAVLHHDVGSMTVSVTARLEAAEQDLRAGRHRAAIEALRDCRGLFAQSVERLRALAGELRPPDLDLLGLRAALQQHLVRVGRETALRIRFEDATGGVAIPAALETVLFRSAQEGLNNIVAHAGARQARVRLSVKKGRIRLRLRDDGRGFDASLQEAAAADHLGLRAVQEMVASAGGDLLVDSAPGRGTVLEVQIPLGGPSA